jgi:hypothetical protein
MIAGAFLSIDVSSGLFALAFQMEGDGAVTLLAIGGGAFLAGFGIMFAAYRKFRYGEIFEYRAYQRNKKKNVLKKIGNLAGFLEFD